MLGFMKDFANLLTLAGLFCGLFGIYFAVRGLFSAAMISMLFALWFDWFDGPIARRSPGRSPEFGEFGAQLDSLVDVVCGGVCPALVLLSYCEFSLWAFPGAFMLLAAGVVRLSYFNSFCSGQDPTYLGLTIDSNLIAVPLVFLLDGLIGHAAFVVCLYAVIVVLAILNVSSFRMPKPGAGSYYLITLYVIGLSLSYAWRLYQPIA
jgi:CDP-diacylglycerol---serine O-phosphatidyltransferase